MKMTSYSKVIILLLGAAILSGCAKKKDNNDQLLLLAAAMPAPVAVNFSVSAGASDVTCSSVLASVAGSNDFKINDLRFYISDVKLISAAGEHPVALTQNQWQYKNVALLDFENATGNCNGSTETNFQISGTAPKGTYTGIEFSLGVPYELNHLDVSSSATPAPLNISGMFWTWLTGYKFMKIDFTTAGGTGNLHIGSMGCTSASGSTTEAPTSECKFKNRARIRLEKQGLDLARDKVNLDVQKLLQNVTYTSNVYKCHSMKMGQDTTDCPKIFPQVGIDFATGDNTGSQTAFSIR